jgi:hypothetical protein
MAPDPADPAAAILAGWREAADSATPGPWWFDESDWCWRLHGVAFKIPPQLFPDGEVMIPEQVVNKQILKAPKTGTPYAEYWPDAADAAFIVTARTAMPLLLAAVEAVLNLHARAEKPSRTTRVCAEHVQERTRAHARDLPAWRRDVAACPDCTATEKWVCAEPSCRHECPDDDGWPCPTVRAVTAALAGID